MARDLLASLRPHCRELLVASPRWGSELYRDLDLLCIPRGEVPDCELGVLLPPSFRAAWEARRLPRRIGYRGDARSLLLSDALRRRPGHRRDQYLGLLEPLGIPEQKAPAYQPTEEERARADVPQGHLALNPLSPSGPPVMWGGYETLGQRSQRPVVMYAGPGDQLSTAHPSRIGQPLGELAASLERAAAMVSNDSGLAHFARAVGTPTLVLYGSTAPGETGPAGAHSLEGPDQPCRPCYRKRCPYPGVPCLAISVEEVEEALDELLGIPP